MWGAFKAYSHGVFGLRGGGKHRCFYVIQPMTAAMREQPKEVSTTLALGGVPDLTSVVPHGGKS